MTDADCNIEIEVNTRYLQEHSDPKSGRYAFAYTIDITNRGDAKVKLLNRHWRITDDNNRVEEVKGPGVVGQQPEIGPGQSFSTPVVQSLALRLAPCREATSWSPTAATASRRRFRHFC